MRVRLKADFDMSGFSPRMQVILVAMQRYGMILADNGSPWFFSGTSDVRWDDDELNEVKSLLGLRLRGRQHDRLRQRALIRDGARAWRSAHAGACGRV